MLLNYLSQLHMNDNHPPDSHSDEVVTSCQQVIGILEFQSYLLCEVNRRKKILEEYETSVLQYQHSNIEFLVMDRD